MPFLPPNKQRQSTFSAFSKPTRLIVIFIQTIVKWKTFDTSASNEE